MKKFLAIFVLLFASALIFSMAAFPVNVVADGGFTVTGDADYTYSDGVLTIKNSTDVTISGNGTTTDRIVVNSTSGANITLSGVDIDVSAISDAAAFEITESTTGTVTVTLEGSNSLTSGDNCAGLQKNGDNSELLINGHGGLEVYAGICGACIGGAEGKSSGNITIDVVTDDQKPIKLFQGDSVNARGGAGIGGGKGGDGTDITINSGYFEYGQIQNSGAAIGGGENGEGRGITINGGNFNLLTGSGAAIGGGKGKAGKDIYITGGTILAATSDLGAGIGGGEGADGDNISISGGLITNTYSTGGGACIGGGAGGNGSNITIEDVFLTVNATHNGDYAAAAIGGGINGSGSYITIKGTADVTATGSYDAAGIGGGKGGSGSNITVEGSAVVNAYGGMYGAGIGGGNGGDGTNIKIKDKANVTSNSKGSANSYGNGAGIGGGNRGKGSYIEISGDAVVNAQSAQGAGIGGGSEGVGSYITISDNAEVTATGGIAAGIGGGWYSNGDHITIENCKKVTAISIQGGAGIGGGFSDAQDKGMGTNITISGGEVEATGSGGGAGIGGGLGGDGNAISICDAKVTASSNGAAGIGGGNGGSADGIKIYGKADVTTTGTGGAGIGGGTFTDKGGAAYNISIYGSAKVKATGNGGAAIGSGSPNFSGEAGKANNIKISENAYVEAIGNGGVGIGGYGINNANEGVIEISGGTVIASSSGVGIGNVYNAYVNITISGGDVTATGTAAGIGSTANVGKVKVTGGDVKATATGNCGILADTIQIDKGSVKAIGGICGISGATVTVNGGTTAAIGTAIGIGGADAAVYIRGKDGTHYPWVFTNNITSTNYDKRYENSNNGYLGIVFEYASGDTFTDKEDNNFNEGIVYGTNKTVEITEDYTLTSGKKLTVPAKVTFATKDMFTLDSSILYLKEEATLDKWYKMEIKGTGEIQHEDSSIYKWYGAEKYEFINETNYTELYSLNGSEGIVLCDICGEPEPHNPDIKDEWNWDDDCHWKLGECALGNNCAYGENHGEVTSCSYIVDGTKLYYGVHRYNNTPDRVDGNTRYYYCIDCNYEKKVTGSNTPKPTGSNPTSRTGIIMLYKVDLADGSPLEGAKFGLYSDEECTSLIKSAVSEMDDDNAVVYFKVDAGDTYYVKEISAPSGYRLSGKVFRAKVSSDRTVTYSVVGSSGSSEDIPVCENVKGTGNPGTAAGLGVAGIAVMSGIVCIISLAKKVRKKSDKFDL